MDIKPCVSGISSILHRNDPDDVRSKLLSYFNPNVSTASSRVNSVAGFVGSMVARSRMARLKRLSSPSIVDPWLDRIEPYR